MSDGDSHLNRMPDRPAAGPDNTLSTQNQALNYMNNEILWARIIVRAWQKQEVMDEITKLANSGQDATSFLVKMAQEFQAEMKTTAGVADSSSNYTFVVSIPKDVETRIVVDTPKLVHLIMPPVENIPSSAVNMTPHAL